jgi:hypothetical protein
MTVRSHICSTFSTSPYLWRHLPHRAINLFCYCSKSLGSTPALKVALYIQTCVQSRSGFKGADLEAKTYGSVCVYVCIYKYKYKYKHLYVCMYVCIYACACVCVFLFKFQSALGQVNNFFQSEFSTECDLVLSFVNLQYPLFSLRPSSSCLLLLPCLPVISSSYLFFNNVF